MKHKKTDTLVLNKSFKPIHIIEWKKAMSLIFQGNARPLDRDLLTYEYEDWLVFSDMNTENYPLVCTINRKIAIPEIIVLRNYDRLPTRDVKYSRQTLFERDKHRCGYCGEVFERKNLTIDHILPSSMGGRTTWNNTISSCFACNNLKANRTPEQARMPLKFKPRKPEWFSPLSNIKPDHPCKSWTKFMSSIVVD